MEMTASEIVTSYKEAKDKKSQITILAQLNCCDDFTITECLRKNGVDVEEPKRRGRPSTKETKKTETKNVENAFQSAAKIKEAEEDLNRLNKILSIPKVVRKVCDDRIAEITNMIIELEKERDTLLDFLNGVI